MHPTVTRRPARLKDRAAATAERLAGEAFDRQDAAVSEWIDEALAGAYTDLAQELARDVIRSAIAFCVDSAHLTALKIDVDWLRAQYIDSNAGRFYDEAWAIEVDADAAAAEAYAETMAEARRDDAYQVSVRG